MTVKNSKISMISVVWFIPVVAIITGIWLSYDYYKSLGESVTLYISNANGLKVNNTVLKVLNVEVGKIKSMKLTPDSKSVIMKAYINSDNKQLLAEDAQYWVVKPIIAKGGVSGLSTLISGSYIEIMPGMSKTKKNEFIVYDRPPLMSYQSQGSIVKLIGKDNGTLLGAGSAILYKGIHVGTVEHSYFDPITKTTHYQIFISSPNDELLGKNINFWITFGISLDGRGGEIKIKGLNFDNLVGSISFSEPKGMDKGDPIDEDYEFPLYSDESEIPINVPNNTIYLVGFFNQDIRNLIAGSSVEYKGIKVGEVIKAPYYAGSDKKNMFKTKEIPVLFYINPDVLDAEYKTLKQELIQAIQNGLVATINSDSLITGEKYVYLYEKTATDHPVYPRKQYQKYPVIPTTLSGVDSLLENINLVLMKIQNLPLEKTVNKLNKNLDELKFTLSFIKNITSDLDSGKFIDNLNNTIKELDKTLKSISPSSKIYKDLNNLIQNLDQISRKINEKPNSLLFNYNKKDPIPKATVQ
ncbi:MAG: MCE family protein [Neisseriaceae bacterium]|nr:MAG: MCE family protein [Neisseriaceae bacterium]